MIIKLRALIWALFFISFLSGCASHHTRGYVVDIVDSKRAVITLEGPELKEGSELLVFRDECRMYYRGIYDCQKRQMGEASVIKIIDANSAEITATSPLKEDDYLELK